MDMKRVGLQLALLACLAVMPGWVAYAQDEGPKKSRAAERREEQAAKRQAKEESRSARKGEGKGSDDTDDYKRTKKGFDYTREFQALKEAQALLAEVNDEKSAQNAVKKIKALFGPLPIPLKGTDQEIEMWSREQNKVSAQMNRLRKEPWFESSGLQEAWTLVSDPFSRRRAQKTK